jgi:hypothetical protein
MTQEMLEPAEIKHSIFIRTLHLPGQEQVSDIMELPCCTRWIQERGNRCPEKLLWRINKMGFQSKLTWEGKAKRQGPRFAHGELACVHCEGASTIAVSSTQATRTRLEMTSSRHAIIDVWLS